MSDATIIKEFLVSLGFKVDQNSLNKFDSTIAKAGKNVLGYAAAISAVAVATVAFVDHVAGKLNDLYWSSVRLRDSVPAIQDFQLGISKMGGSAEGAAAALENMARFIRTNPAAESWLNNLGVKTRDAHNNLRSTIDIVKQFAGLPIPYWLKVKLGGQFGIDENTLQAIIRAAPEAEDAVSKFYKTAGIDAQQAASDGRDFNNQMLEFKAIMNAVAVVLETRLLPFAKGFLIIAVAITTALVKLDKITAGWGSTLLYVAIVAAGIGLVFGWIPALITAIGLAAVAVIGNFDKIKAKADGVFAWLRHHYNNLARSLGLRLIPGDEGTGAAPKDPDKVPGGPDFKTREAGLGPNSQYGSDPTTKGAVNPGDSKAAVDFFQKMGWTANQAVGIVANLIQESGIHANLVGDHGTAYGVAQWHADRQANFKAWAGHDIKNSTLQEQLAFVQHELTKGTYGNAGKLLAVAKTAAEAAMIVSQKYEQPEKTIPEMQGRAGIANRLQAKLAPNGGNSSGVVIHQKTDINVNGGDPAATGRAVAGQQSRVNGDMVRNLAGASS